MSVPLPSSSSLPPSPLSPSQPSPLSLYVDAKQLDLEVCTLPESLERFTSMVLKRASSPTSTRLFCSLPTECCTDLHDLRSLQARAFETIHTIVSILRQHKIHATYCLCPSSEAVAILSAGQRVEGYTGMGGRDEVRVGDLGVPVLIIS